MDRALFLGTPAGSKWTKQWRANPNRTDPGGDVAEVASYQEWLALPADDRARRRYVLLSHHEDPITRFEPALVVQEPGWLGPATSRPPAISHLANWYPLTTFVLTLVDVKNAMNVTPGTFFARGHDYRADLARMVSEAYGLPAGDTELLAIEHALRRREAMWAQRRLVAEQLRRAKEAVQRQTKGLGYRPRHDRCQLRGGVRRTRNSSPVGRRQGAIPAGTRTVSVPQYFRVFNAGHAGNCR
jgi:hypothetical protein